MLHESISQVVSWFENAGLIQHQNVDWCIYVIERKLITTVSFLAIFFLCCCVTHPLNAFALLLGITQIRKWAGGYHCKTLKQCFLLSVGIALLGAALANLIVNNSHVVLLLTLAGTLCLVKGPIDQPSLHMSTREMHGNRKRLRIVQFVIVVVVVLGAVLRCPVSAYVAVGYTEAAISVAVAYYKQRRLHYEN